MLMAFSQSLFDRMTATHQLTAYFDESGEFQNSEYAVVGGCVFKKEDIPPIHSRWRMRLNDEGIDYTSMKDALRFSGIYESWAGQEQRRDALLLDLAQVLVSSPMLRVWSTVTSAEFQALPSGIRERLGRDPHYCAFETCLCGVVKLPNVQVHTVWDLSEEYSATTVKLFNAFRRKNPIAKQRCPAISFCDDRFEHGLQMADMISYCARAGISGQSSIFLPKLRP